jgi:hypothetical protein
MVSATNRYRINDMYERRKYGPHDRPSVYGTVRVRVRTWYVHCRNISPSDKDDSTDSPSIVDIHSDRITE